MFFSDFERRKTFFKSAGEKNRDPNFSFFHDFMSFTTKM